MKMAGWLSQPNIPDTDLRVRSAWELAASFPVFIRAPRFWLCSALFSGQQAQYAGAHRAVVGSLRFWHC
jgi:hypothetical protein